MSTLWVLVALAGCATPGPDMTAPSTAALPPSIPSDVLVGRWGKAAYHRDTDRARTETMARGQCGKPYVINRGPTGGVMMHLADQRQPEELRTKGGPGNKTF